MRETFKFTCIFFYFFLASRLISFGQNCSVNAGVNQTICADQSLTLVGVKAGLAPNPTVWSQVLGTPATISSPNALTTSITGFGVGNYRFRLTTTCQDGVTVFDDVDITIVSAINVNAGPDITKCKQAAPVGTTITLAAQPVGPGETGAWTVQSGASGTFSNVNSPTSTFTIPTANVCTNTTVSTLAWTISNGICSKVDNTVIAIIGGDPINAGPDQTTGCGSLVTLAASCPGAAPQAGQWTVVSGPTSPIFSNAASPTSTVSNLIVGTYTLRWTVNGSCVSGSDDMVITVNPVPTPTISAGSNQTVTCSASASLAGTTFVAPQQAQWSIVSGPGGGFFSNPNVSNPTISGLQLGTYTLQYTIFGPCYTATANVNLTVNSNVAATTSNAGSNLSYCQGSIPNPIGLNGNAPNAGETGLWTQTGGSTSGITINNPTSPNATVSGISAAGTYTFRWTISRGACTSQNSMNITITTAPTVSAGPDQTLACNATTATLAGTPSGGNWSFISGPATPVISGSSVSGMNNGGTYVFRYSLTTGCGVISDFVNIFVSRSPALANAGTDQNLACNVTSTFLAGNAPTGGSTGTWSVLSGPNAPTIANVNLNTTGISGLIPGTYTFRWTINNGFVCPPSRDEVIIRVVSSAPTSSAAGTDISSCYGMPVYMSANTPLSNETGTWTYVSGPAGTTIVNPNNPTTAITGLVASSTYTFRWTIANACGSSFDDVVITTTSTQGPTTPNAGVDKCVATSPVAMTGNTPTIGTGLWSQISGPAATITSPSSPTTSINLTGGAGNYQFVWTITSGSCPSLKDTVNVTLGGAPTAANAGADQSICGFSVTLAGNTPTVGTGLWTMGAGNGGAVITSPTSPNTTVTGLTPGLYNFIWTTTNGTCGSSTDNVDIIVSQPPSPADAGLDIAGCGSGPFALAAVAPAVGTGAWSVVSGSATFSNVSSPTSTVSPTTPITTLRWTVTSGPSCVANTDDVVVTTVPTANAGSSQTVCNATTVNLLASNPGAGTGAWTQTAGSAATIATPSSNATSVSGLVAPGTYTFRWDVTGGGCPATNSSVTITNSATPTTPTAGPDQTVCPVLPTPNTASVTMAANTPVIGTGTWTKVSGPTGTITTPNSPTTTITNMAPGSYRYRWTISNGACTSLYDEVDIFVPPVTVANAGADQTLCFYNTVATLNGNSPVSGVGTWTMLSGPNTPNIVLPNIYNTQVTGLVPGTYNFQWRIENGACSSSDVMVLTVQSSVPATPTTTSSSVTICSTPGTFNLTTVASAPSTAGGVMEWHVANSYTSPLVSSPTAAGAGTYYLFERNTNGCYSASAAFTVITQDCGIYGNVYNDANGLTNSIVDGTPTNISGALYANLVNSSGNVIGVAPVLSNGTYGFPSVAGNSTYNVVLSIIYGTVGAPVSALLPTNWVNTGENLGAGAGNDGTVNGALSVSITTSNVFNANFGIEQRPIPTGITLPSVVNPTGTNEITLSPSNFTGTDGDNTIVSVRYTTFPSGVTSITIGGVVYTSFPVGGITVPVGTSISIDPVNGTGSAIIPFVLIDELGVESFAPANVIQPFTDLVISGTVFDDGDGLVDNTVDGTGVGLPSGTQLYANLVNTSGNVVGVVPVAANGTYSIGTANGVLANTNFTVVVSTTQGTVGNPVTSVLPTNWVNTGENLGAGTGNDGTVNGSLSVAVGTTNVTNANFGIEQRPVPANNTAASQVNPGGTNNATVPATTFTATDADGTVSSIRITAFPTNATSITINGTTYTSATFPVGGVTVPTNGSGNPTQTITVDPIDGAVTVGIPYRAIDNAGFESTTTATASVPFTTLGISGNVFDDANGLTDATVNGTGTNVGGALYANLLDNSGNVLATIAVSGTGTYSFAGLNAGNYSVQISTNQGTVGNPAPATALPTNWVNTGENLGTAAGNDGSTNGNLAVTLTSSNVTNANFGIEQRPVPANNTAASQVNPGGTTNATVPATTFTATDADGTVSSIRITAFPTNATSITINGTQYTSATFPVGGVTVPTNGSGNPTQTITVDPIDGAVTVGIPYRAIDNAGFESTTTATASVPFTTLGISGNVYDDANGLTDATVNGTGTNVGGALYANLLDNSGNVIATTAVSGTGTYSFAGLNAGNYSVQISTNQGTVGNPAPATALPTNWVNTGENLGTAAGNDGSTNGNLAVTLTSSNVTNANFGIEQRPVPANNTAASQVNPGGTNNATVPATTFTATDADGTVSSIRITAFPTNATSITINGTTYTSATFPVGGVTVPTNGSGNPTQTITVDPVDGAVTVGIPYVAIDNAGFESTTTATASVPFTTLGISGNVYDDANGLTDATVNGTGTNVGGALYANLLDNSGNVLATTAVSGTGTYSFAGLNAGNYSVQISTNQGTVGSPGPATALPTNWVNTGENLGTAAGNDGTVNGNLAVTLTTSDVVDANFGIEQLPVPTSNTAASQVNPGGTNNATVPATTFTATDADGTVSSIRITAFPTNVTSITINGTTYTSATFPVGGVTVPTNGSGNPTQTITVDPIDGAVTVGIPYVAIDNAGFESTTTATASVPFTTLGISGNVFNDADGLTDATVNGTGTNVGGALYANLLDNSGNVIATTAVSGTGTYSFAGLNAGNYSVQISTNQGTVGNPAPATALPTNWVNTGENLGTAAGNDGSTNGNLAVTLTSSNVTNANFGIEQRPVPANNTAASQVNPGGTTNATVPATTFTATDADGTVSSIRITAFPTNATSITINGTTYTSATFPVGGVTVPTNGSGNPTQTITVDPINGAVTVGIPYVAIDNAGFESTTTATASVPFTTLGISGNVFNDANGLTDATVNGTGTNVSGALYANLLDNSGNVLATTAVSGTGTYSFAGLDAGNYSVQISTNQGTVGSPAPATALPTNWVNTGENLGTAAGNDGTVNGNLAVTLTTSDVVDANFGIEQLPVPTSNTAASQVNPGGTNNATVPATTFTATDADGTVSSIRITAFPTNATSITINGTTYTSATFPVGGVTVPTNASGNPTQTITVDPIDGAVTVGIPYVAIDNAGFESTTTATASVPFTTLGISGNVFDDANGLTDATVNGTGTNVGGALYANLLDNSGNVIATTAVSGTGTYSFAGLDAGNYSVQISTNQGTVGNPAPATALPTNWVNTGENLGTAAGNDGTVNGNLAVTLTTSDVVDANFGIEQLPVPTSNTAASQVNPGGTNNATVPATTFTATDADGTVSSIRITAFPTNATSITINGTTYTSATFPAGGVTVPTNGSGNPTQTITVDPIDGAVTVGIPYVAIDNAGFESTTTATASVPFTTLGISGNVFDDANGLTDATVNGAGIDNPDGVQLYVNVLDVDGRVIATDNVAPDGSYEVLGLNGGTYTLQLSTTQGTVGALAPTTPLPTNWVHTGENLGTAAGNDGVVNGNQTFTLSNTSLSDLNFGINKLAVADDKTYVLSSNPVYGSTLTLDGVAGNPAPLSGMDNEDGGQGTGSNFIITSVSGLNGSRLFYNGVLVTDNFMITNYNPSLLQIEFGGSSSSLSFQYASIDASNTQGAPATYSLSWPTAFPVELLDFNAVLEGADGVLRWTTSMEINTSHFEIERSLDGGFSFEYVGTKQAAGNSDTPLNYTFKDIDVVKMALDKVYYRLRNVDIDNSYTYSNVVELKIEQPEVYMTLYPNPTQATLNVVYQMYEEKVAEVKIINALGQTIHRELVTPTNEATQSLQLNVESLASGTYFLQINTETKTVMRKFVKE